MPAVIFVTEMERGLLKAALQRGELQGEGPTDRTLVIEYDGDPKRMPGLHDFRLDIGQFAAACPAVRQLWIPQSGSFPARITPGRQIVVTVTFP